MLRVDEGVREIIGVEESVRLTFAEEDNDGDIDEVRVWMRVGMDVAPADNEIVSVISGVALRLTRGEEDTDEDPD